MGVVPEKVFLVIAGYPFHRFISQGDDARGIGNQNAVRRGSDNIPKEISGFN